jgi:hypothetical protein
MTAGPPQKVAGKRNDSVETRISCTVQAGYHVNSNTPTDEYLIPLKLTWASTGALRPVEVVYPKPTMEKYQFALKPLSVLTGKFDLVARFKVGPDAVAGPGQALGKLKYQACNDRACYPPRTIDIAVSYNIM